MSAEQLAQELQVTKVCIRRHLSLLESDGLISYVEERHERGRPRFIYSLTEKARCLFPQTYDEFAGEILAQLQRRYGKTGLEVVLKGRADELIEQLKIELAGLNFDERVKCLAKTMSTKGYLADARRLKDGTYRLRQRNCPTESVAVAYPQICDEEVRVYRESLGCQVTRECRIADGAQFCEFRISSPALTQISRGSDEKGKI